MSKQSDAKKSQGYIQKAIKRECSNCIRFDYVEVRHSSGDIEEKNFRCGLGGFAVKKQGVCDVHSSHKTVN